jgi:membrane protease YdiL (CAAX protease family)
MQLKPDDDGREPPSGSPEPGPEPPFEELGLFDRTNNYLLLVYAVACLLMNFAVAGLLYFRGMIILSLSTPGIVSILFPLYLLSRRSAIGFAREFRFAAVDARTTAIVIVLSAAVILPVDAFSTIFERMWPPDAQYTSFVLSIKPKGTVSFFTISLGVVLIAAVTEELLFRGFVQRIFQRNMPGPLAVALAGVLFSLSHFNPPLIPGIAVLGILYGYIYYKTGNLWYSIIGHGLFNLVTLVRLDRATEEEIVSATVSAPDRMWTIVSAVAFVCAIWLFRRSYREASERR